MSDREHTDALKLAAKIRFVGRPSVIAAGICLVIKPKSYDLLMLTGNITKPTLLETVAEIKKIKR